MFHSVRIGNWKITAACIVCFLIFLTVCLLMLRAAPPDHVTVGDEQVGLKIDGDDEIETFIAECGYPVEGCVSDEAITVPKHWNKTYTAYNELQRHQGFDLRPYKGKPARKLLYALTDREEYVTILIAGDRIIGADIATMRQGDFPQPLL